MKDTMTIALIIVSTLIGIAAAGSAFGKLTGNPEITETMHSVGVNDVQIRILASLELLGAAGLAVGIFVPVLGAAAAGALALYFLGAVVSRARAGHGPAEFTPALMIALGGIASTWLQLQR
jgi:uncharacterized membrane protein YphA (DoxX/SURF4 family)